MADWTVKFRHGGELTGVDAEIAEMEGSTPFAYSQAFIDTGDRRISVEVTWDSREPGANERAEQIARLLATSPDLLAAAKALEQAENAWANCDECGGEEMPELCPKCFPLFDEARLQRREAIAKATDPAAETQEEQRS